MTTTRLHPVGTDRRVMIVEEGTTGAMVAVWMGVLTPPVTVAATAVLV